MLTCDKCKGTGALPEPLSVDGFVNWIDAQLGKGLSMADIGDKLGASRQSISQWLTRSHRPNRATLLLAERIIQEEGATWPAVAE